MSALDKIIEGILEQANEKAAGILAEANQKADEIIKKGEIDRTGRKQQFEEAAEVECREILNRAQSADRQSRRLALLEVRNQILDEVIEEAKTKLSSSANQDKFNMVWQGDILINNSVDAIFEAENQSLRGKAYEILTADA